MIERTTNPTTTSREDPTHRGVTPFGVCLVPGMPEVLYVRQALMSRKMLLSSSRRFNSPANYLRTPHVRVEPPSRPPLDPLPPIICGRR
eukprot:3109419-Pyramimonas_sp.AAC.1